MAGRPTYVVSNANVNWHNESVSRTALLDIHRVSEASGQQLVHDAS
jgi:hypothetical protein